jgi:hypothetical protein
MFLRRRFAVIVEMVNDQCALVGGDVDVDFVEQRLDSNGSCLFAGQREEDVSFLLQEIEERVRC